MPWRTVSYISCLPDAFAVLTLDPFFPVVHSVMFSYSNRLADRKKYKKNFWNFQNSNFPTQKILIFPQFEKFRKFTAMLINSTCSRSNWSILRCSYLFHTRAFSLLIVVVLVPWPTGHFKDREALLADGEAHLVTGFFFLNPSQWVFLVFCFFLVFFFRFAAEERVFRVFSVSRILLGASRL